MKPSFSRAMVSPERVGDCGKDIVEVRDVVVGTLDRAGCLRHREHLGAGLAGDEVRGVGRIPVLEQDDLGLLVPHSADEPGQVLRGGRNTGPVLDDATLDEAEGPEHVRPAIVMADDARAAERRQQGPPSPIGLGDLLQDRKSTRLNSSHSQISYAVFCLKKKKTLTLITVIALALTQ